LILNIQHNKANKSNEMKNISQFWKLLYYTSPVKDKKNIKLAS